MAADAYDWIDFLSRSGITLWQLLPICPVDELGSPYNSRSACAGNPDFIDLGFLQHPPYRGCCDATSGSEPLWQQAFAVFRAQPESEQTRFWHFLEQQRDWLDNHCLYTHLKQTFGCDWTQWPESFRRHDTDTLQHYRQAQRDELLAIAFQQYTFWQQWASLKRYANERSIEIVGDMPIFVAHDSADCWSSQSLFTLDSSGAPTWVAGVPPDYFSATGQRWGNPQYDWSAMQQQDFDWWTQRLQRSFQRYDLVRVDHFRGFESSWFIPASESEAINGHWQEVPGVALFQHLLQHFSALPIIAEDLGVITPAVEHLRDTFHLPGMKILQFAFDGNPDNPYLPAHHIAHCVLYTGTHDNDTLLGWYRSLNETERARVHNILNADGHLTHDMPWMAVSAALESVANTVIIPAQDLLGLDGQHRMNTPGTSDGNWRWRLPQHSLTPQLSQRLQQRLQTTRR